MRIKKRKDGWDEIVTTKVTIINKGSRVFSTAGEWIEFTNKRPGLNKGGRNHCQCCGVKWEDCDPNENTYILFTNKGNKIVCKKCFNSFI